MSGTRDPQKTAKPDLGWRERLQSCTPGVPASESGAEMYRTTFTVGVLPFSLAPGRFARCARSCSGYGCAYGALAKWARLLDHRGRLWRARWNRDHAFVGLMAVARGRALCAGFAPAAAEELHAGGMLYGAVKVEPRCTKRHSLLACVDWLACSLAQGLMYACFRARASASALARYVRSGRAAAAALL